MGTVQSWHRHCHLGILFVVILLVNLRTTALGSGSNIEWDACIIGAGAGGMSTAALLKDKGYHNILILERDAEFGGACNTFSFFNSKLNKEQVVDPGVIMFPNTSYANSQGCGPWQIDTAQFITRFAGPNSLAPQPFTSDIQAYAADWSRNINLGPSTAPPPIEAELEAYVRLNELVRTKYPWADTANFPNPLLPELLIPFDEWVVANNFTALNSRWQQLIYNAGYGPLHDVTALYPLLNTACTSLLFGTSPTSWMYLPNGCIQIYNGIRNYIGAQNVWLNVTVQNVFRPIPGATYLPTVILGTQNGNYFAELCKKVIISITPLSASMQFLHPDPIEEAVFVNVRDRLYFAGVANLTGPLLEAPNQKWDLANVDVTQPTGEVIPPMVMAFERYVVTNGPTSFQGFSSTPLTNAQAEQLAYSQFANIPPQLINSTNILYIEAHSFQPHFIAQSLQQNPSPYVQLENLQGYRNTYYLGGINAFSNSAVIWNKALRFVAEYF